MGAGTTLIEVLLAKNPKTALGTDINEKAIISTIENLTKYGLTCPVISSDVLDQVAKGVLYDVIYWNYPFHFKS